MGVVAPAGPVSRKDVQAALDLMESSGLRISLGRHVFGKADYLAGDDLRRLADFHDMFRDPGVKAVFCARGGYGTLRLLDRIDYPLIQENPKIVVGYSDITALLMAIHRKTGLVTFHGPLMREVARRGREQWEGLFRLLKGEGSLSCSVKPEVSTPGAIVKGPLLGGNLSIFCHLVGTPFFPPLGGSILFVEETGEPLYRVDRMFTHLRLSGQLAGLAGLVAGQFEDCGPLERILPLLKESVAGSAIPIGAGLAAGHGSENQTLPLGAQAELDLSQSTLSITEPFVAG